MTTTTRPQTPWYDDVIDLERYPIHDRASSKYQALVQGCRDQLRDRGEHPAMKLNELTQKLFYGRTA